MTIQDLLNTGWNFVRVVDPAANIVDGAARIITEGPSWTEIEVFCPACGMIDATRMLVPTAVSNKIKAGVQDAILDLTLANYPIATNIASSVLPWAIIGGLVLFALMKFR